MAEYIERRSASNALYEGFEFAVRHELAGAVMIPACEVKAILLRFEKALNSVSTADVASVVRCKDCKHSCLVGAGAKKLQICHNPNALWFDCEDLAEVADDFFCAYGEM